MSNSLFAFSFLRTSSVFITFIIITFFLLLIVATTSTVAQQTTSGYFYKFAVGGPNSTYRDALVSRRCYRSSSGVVSSCGPYQAVCDDGFNSQTARVIARAPWGLNYTTSGKFGWRTAQDYRTNSIGTNLVNVVCSKGILNTFTNSCSYMTTGRWYCSAWESVLMDLNLPEIHYSFKRTSDNLLLAKNDSYSKWGAVCDDPPFDHATAYAVCRQLGKTNLTKVMWFGGGNYDSVQRAGVTNFSLDSLSCPKEATNFSKSCTHDLFGKHDCSLKTEALSLFCNSSDRVPLQFRLSSTGYISVSAGVSKDSYSPFSTYISAEGMSQSTVNKLCLWATGFGSDIVRNGAEQKNNCTLIFGSSRAQIWNFTCPDNATKVEECDFTFDPARSLSSFPYVRVVRVVLPDIFDVIVDSRTNAFLVTAKPELLPPSAPRVASTICTWYISYSYEGNLLCKFAGFPDDSTSRAKRIFWGSNAPVQLQDLLPSNNISVIGGQFWNTNCPVRSTPLTSFAQCTSSHANYQRCGTYSSYLQGTCDGTGLSPSIDKNNHNYLKIRDRHNSQHFHVQSVTEPGYSGILSPTTAAALCRMMGHKNVTNTSVTVASRSVYRSYYYSSPSSIIRGLRCLENATHIRDCDYQYVRLQSSGYLALVVLFCTSPRDEWKFSYAPGTKIVLAQSPAGIGHVESGPICGYYLDKNAARFVCRQLAKNKTNGFTYDPLRVDFRLANATELKLSNKSVALGSLRCSVNATNMSACTFNERNSCYYREAAAILCDAVPTIYNFSLDRKSNTVLASAPNASENAPRITGRICIHSLNSLPGIARVVCKSLGYTDLTHALGWRRGYCNSVTCPDAYGRRGRISYVSCPPDAQDQSECELTDDSRRLSYSSCSNYYSLAVTCTPDAPERNFFRFQKVRSYSPIRIYPPSSSSSNGPNFVGDFSTTPDLQTTLTTLCKFAGYRYNASSSPAVTKITTCWSTPAYTGFFDNISCNSSATKLSECSWRAAGYSRCYSQVFCGSSTRIEPWQFKLRDGDNAVLAKAPGSMSPWSEFEYYYYYRATTAAAICRSLGFTTYLNISYRAQTEYMGVCQAYVATSSSTAQFSQSDANARYYFTCGRSYVDQILALRCQNKAPTTTSTVFIDPYKSTTSTTTTTTTTTASSPQTTSTRTSGNNNNDDDNINSSHNNNAAASNDDKNSTTFKTAGIPIVIVLVIVILLLIFWLVKKNREDDKENAKNQIEQDAISIQLLSDQANASQSASLMSQSAGTTHTGFIVSSSHDDDNNDNNNNQQAVVVASHPTSRGAGGLSGQQRRAAESIHSAKTEQEVMEEELLAAVAPVQSFAFSSSPSSKVNVPSSSSQQKQRGEENENDASEILKAVARALGSPSSGSSSSSSSSSSLTAASLATASAASQKPEQPQQQEEKEGEEKQQHLAERTKQVHQPLAALGSSSPSAAAAAAAASKKWKSKSSKIQEKERKEKERHDVVNVMELADL